MGSARDSPAPSCAADISRFADFQAESPLDRGGGVSEPPDGRSILFKVEAG
jgi:hypothetical protein